MFWTKSKVSSRTLTLSIAALCLAAAGLIVGAQYNSIDASTSLSASNSSSLTLASQPAATFNGANMGAIPDAPTGNCWGAFVPTPRNVTFDVSGVSGPPTNVELSTTFGGPNHTWVGDVRATLIAPNGASHIVFSRTGATTSGASGDSSDLAGPYTFKDTAAGVNWWTAAANETTGTAPVPAGDYRTTGAGGAGQTNPAPVTNMTAAFGGVANPTGTWTLRLEDGCAGDTGSISAATLNITGGPAVPVDAPVDFTGDGKTDYTVVRITGGGPSGQVTWFYDPNGGGATQAYAWGLGTDFFVPEDYDGDGKDDIAVWRPGAPGTWYILNSNGFTARVEAYGQTGDDPTVVGDYNNDGKADLAVYRDGASVGMQSFWYYRTVPNGAVTFFPWGTNGDFPAPGDYDGDGSNDFVVQRSNGAGGQARFWIRLATGAESSVVFGTPTDVIVPGDYDGDGKTDIAVARGSLGSPIVWYYDPSSIAGVQVVQNTFGIAASDYTVQGDYDGDGRTDIAIWRPSATPGQSVFWSFNSSTSSAVPHGFGSIDDYPVANYNSH